MNEKSKSVGGALMWVEKLEFVLSADAHSGPTSASAQMIMISVRRRVYSPNSINSICCRFVLQQVVQQIHNVLTLSHSRLAIE